MKLVTKQEKKTTQTQTSMATHNVRYDIAYMFPGCTVFKYRLNSGDDKDCIRRRKFCGNPAQYRCLIMCFITETCKRRLYSSC